MIKYILLFLFLPLYSFAQSSDTLLVQENEIVFYSVTHEEYDELKQDPNSGVDEVLSDMRYYANQYAKFNKDSLGVKFTISGAPYFRVITSKKDTLIHRNSLSHIVGFIANDGEKFIVKEGVFTDVGIAQIIYKNLNFRGN